MKHDDWHECDHGKHHELDEVIIFDIVTEVTKYVAPVVSCELDKVRFFIRFILLSDDHELLEEVKVVNAAKYDQNEDETSHDSLEGAPDDLYENHHAHVIGLEHFTESDPHKHHKESKA